MMVFLASVREPPYAIDRVPALVVDRVPAIQCAALPSCSTLHSDTLPEPLVALKTPPIDTVPAHIDRTPLPL
jgi:hypothetical protein